MKIKHFFPCLLLLFSLPMFGQIKISGVKKTRNDSTFYLHTVKRGHTLFSISRAYKVSQQEIRKINHLSSSSAIKKGQVLYIPVPTTTFSYLEHKVEPGHTLFSLSKRYKIPMEEIIKLNPTAAQGLKVGQILKIPQKGKTGSKNTYTVKDGDTLFSLSRKFNVSMEEILRMNPQVKTGLKAGQILHLPGSSSNSTPAIDGGKGEQNDTPIFSGDCATKSFSNDKVFEVALMLPLFLKNNKFYLDKYKGDKDKMYFGNTKQFFEIYNGVLTALNRLKKEGISVHLHVYDTKKDSVEVKQLMQKPEMQKMDLLIGPVYSENVKIAARYANRYGIHLVSPLSRNEDLLVGNPSVLQVVPPHEEAAVHISRILRKRNDIKRLLIIHKGSKRERAITKRYKQLFQEDSVKIREINFGITGKNSFRSIDKAIVREGKNYIIVPSENEVFVSRILNRLYILSKNHTFEVWGSNRWMYFQNMDLNKISHLHIRMFSPFFVDYESEKTQAIITSYRKAFKTEPTSFAFKGYDVCRFFVTMLKKFGKDFSACLSSAHAENYQGVIQKYRFVPRNEGQSNTHAFILYYDEDFALKQLDE